MRNNLIAVGLIVSALSGCLSTSQVRKGGDQARFTSRYPALQIASCITEKWENGTAFTGSQRVDLRPTVGGFTVVLGKQTFAANQTFMVADVMSAPDGSDTVFYESTIFTGAFKDMVSSCQ